MADGETRVIAHLPLVHLHVNTSWEVFEASFLARGFLGELRLALLVLLEAFLEDRRSRTLFLEDTSETGMEVILANFWCSSM